MGRDELWDHYEAAKRAAEGAPALSEAADQRRKALRDVQAADCADGFHDDPDNSGLCIRCGAEL